MVEVQSSDEEGDGDGIGTGIDMGFGVGSEVCSASAFGSVHARDETRGRKGEVGCAARTNLHRNFTVYSSASQTYEHVFPNCSSAHFMMSSPSEQTDSAPGVLMMDPLTSEVHALQRVQREEHGNAAKICRNRATGHTSERCDWQAEASSAITM